MYKRILPCYVGKHLLPDTSSAVTQLMSAQLKAVKMYVYEYTTSTAHTMPKAVLCQFATHTTIYCCGHSLTCHQHCCHLNCRFSTTLSQTSAVTAFTELAQLFCISLLIEFKDFVGLCSCAAVRLVTSIGGPVVLRCLSVPLAFCLQALQSSACL